MRNDKVKLCKFNKAGMVFRTPHQSLLHSKTALTCKIKIALAYPRCPTRRHYTLLSLLHFTIPSLQLPNVQHKMMKWQGSCSHHITDNYYYIKQKYSSVVKILGLAN